MARRSLRIALVLLGLAVTVALVYPAVLDEQILARARAEDAVLDRSAEEALVAIADLRASLHAYVAPGQALPVWISRSATQLDAIRERMLALDTALAAAVPALPDSLANSLDGVDQLTAAEKRARGYAARGEHLLAGDVIFTEVHDLLTAATEQVQTARAALGRDSDGRLAGVRQEQAGLAAGAIAVWTLIALMLLPAAALVAKQDPNQWRQELADRLKKAETADLAPKPAESAAAREDSGELRRDLGEAASGREGGPAVLKTVGEICADLSSLSDIGALSGALERAADVLGAGGMIVWVASNDGGALSPVANHGFDARLVERIGSIPRDSSNLTAAAFRQNVALVSAPTSSTPSALAVAMCGPSGPVGVLSAELRPGRTADDACVALATIFAAQLATLAFPVAAVPAIAEPGEPRARRAAR